MQKLCMMSHQMDTRLSHKPQLFTALIFHYAVVALLLTLLHEGRSQQIGQPQPLVVLVGDDITLPCHVKPASDAVDVMVEWSRPDLQPRFVHLRRSGEDSLIDQNPSYKGRTSVSIDGLKQGDLSLRLSKVKFSDEGTYRCFAPDLDTDSTVHLVVDMIKIAKVSNGVLECKYRGLYPELLELLWLDSEGNRLSAGPTETVRGPDDLYTVSSSLTVEKGHSNNFTCRAQEKSTSQSKETRIHVPDDFFTDSSGSSAPVIIGVFVAIMVILAAVFGLWKWRQHKNKGGNNKTDEEKGRMEKNSTESERESLKKKEADNEKTGKNKNQVKVKEGNNGEPSTEETKLLCQVEKETQPVEVRTKGESDNVVIQKQSEDAGTGSQSLMENGGQEHQVQKEGEMMNDFNNTEKGAELMSEERRSSSSAECERNQEKPEENKNMRTREEESAITGTEDKDLKNGDAHQEDTAEDVRADPDMEENQEQKETTNNEQAGKSSTGEEIKRHVPQAGRQTVNNLDNNAEAPKSGTEEHNRGDTTPMKHARNTKSQKTEVQNPDKKDEDKTENPAKDDPADQGSTAEGRQGNDPGAGGGTSGDLRRTEAKGKGAVRTAVGQEHQETTLDNGDEGVSTTPQSAVDRPAEKFDGAVEPNDSGKKDEETSSEPTTGEKQVKYQAGDERKTEQHTVQKPLQSPESKDGKQHLTSRETDGQTGEEENKDGRSGTISPNNITENQAGVCEDTKQEAHVAGGDPVTGVNKGPTQTEAPSETDGAAQEKGSTGGGSKSKNNDETKE